MTTLNLMILVVGVVLFVLARQVRARRMKELLDYVAENIGIHPKVFFKYWRRRYQPWPFNFPIAERLQLPVLDFRKGEPSVPPKQSILPLLRGLWSTWIIARSGLYAGKKWGNEYLHNIANAMMILWCTRMCEVVQLRLEVQDLQHLDSIEDPLLVICNHKSIFDFVAGPLALGLAHLSKRGPVKLRFMAAKDHFVDNFFVYRILKIGLAMQAIGMIFVDRKGKNRKASVDEAVDQMLSSGVDVVIFPQGTRAWPQLDAMGNRWDAGYFAAGKKDRMAVLGGHLKKGAAHLGMQVATRNPVCVLPVAVFGTATVYHKYSLKVQLNETISVRIGEPIRIASAPSDEAAYGAAVKELHQRMDTSMMRVSGIIPRLEQRLLADTRRILRSGEFEDFVQTVQSHRNKEDALFFSVADQIYSLPRDAQHGRLIQFASTARQGASVEDLLAMKRDMAG
ncbi:MAG: hypothetical protein COV45_04815 [Deltaproteobacteria bacterium CG11_big_fil_rev_8_21_14_0_20_47_16]|nr:MAG: hypothetical protein COV45_04815 [Deltaproteobacteria bacterium CG11_big_fil_rev_8_21_14_0_20_47_16]